MRAEMVNVVAAIEKSLGLLAKRLDYDTRPIGWKNLTP